MSPERALTAATEDYAGMELQELAYAQLDNCYGRKETYKLDLITPQESSGAPRAVIVLIHGGGFTLPCTKRQFYIPAFARALTQAGYAVASPEYPLYDTEADRDRENGPIIYERPARAVLTACDFLQGQAQALGLDMGRAAVMGGSAGGMTAFFAAAMRPGFFRALVNLWGPPEPMPDFNGFPPVLSVHGTADQMVPYAREAALSAALDAAGIPNRLIPMEGCGHTPVEEDQLALYMPDVLRHLEHHMA